MEYWSPSDITKLWRLVIGAEAKGIGNIAAEHADSIREYCSEILSGATIGIRLMQIMPEIYDKKT